MRTPVTPLRPFELTASSSHVCSATLTNQDGSDYKPSLAYDPEHNVLSFSNPAAEYAVVRPLSLFLAPSFLANYRSHSTSTSQIRRVRDCSCPWDVNIFGCEHFFLGLLTLCYNARVRTLTWISIGLLVPRFYHVFFFFYHAYVTSFRLTRSFCYTRRLFAALSPFIQLRTNH